MGNIPSSLEFAVIGHQESWESIMPLAQAMRLSNTNNELRAEKVKDIYTYIPPRKIFDIGVRSTLRRDDIRGAYIETFIAPDELDIKYLRKNIEKVKQACEICAKLNVPVVSLGGFSSIVLEAGLTSLTQIQNTFFTTGNTLTAAFIARGIEKACMFWEQPLSKSKLLIIGSTGDIGSACALYFSDKVKQLLLCGRQEAALQKQAIEFTAKNISNKASVQLKKLVDDADIIISVASSIINETDLENIKPNTIVCDAGYPKNLQSKYINNHKRLFYGGMGIVTGGFEFENNLESTFYKFPLHAVGHGCLLEATVLGLENAYCSFSKGRGNITIQAMKDILTMAEKHGIKTAPLFNNTLINATAADILQ